MEQQDFSDIVSSHPALNLVAEMANEKEIEAYVVGGFVRDILLKRESKDIDFVCRGKGIDLAEALGKKVKRKVTVFKRFKTANLRYGDWELEFVGARKESYREDSRNPIVEDGTIDDDQKRRDFTINALAISLNKNNLGQLIDPFDGVNDMAQKVIRTPLEPDVTFSDDPLRMMRAVRFAAQLNFDIEAKTFKAISTNVERIKIVSQERITDELNKIVLSPVPSYGFNLLFQSGLLKEIFPEMVRLHGVEKVKGMGHKDNFYHTLKVLDNVAGVSNDLWLRWAAILHDIAKPATKRFEPGHGWTFHGHEDKGAWMVPKIFRKLKLPLGPQMEYVKKLVKLHLRPIALVKDNITDSAIRRLVFDAGNDVDDLMALCKADVTSKNMERVKRYMQNFDQVLQKIEDVEARDHIKNFQPPVTGEMIMDYFGVKPSRIVGEIKEEIKEAIMEGNITNDYESAFELMKEIGKKKGLDSEQ